MSEVWLCVLEMNQPLLELNFISYQETPLQALSNLESFRRGKISSWLWLTCHQHSINSANFPWISLNIRNKGSGANHGKMLLVRIIENDRIYGYFSKGWLYPTGLGKGLESPTLQGLEKGKTPLQFLIILEKVFYHDVHLIRNKDCCCYNSRAWLL